MRFQEACQSLNRENSTLGIAAKRGLPPIPPLGIGCCTRFALRTPLVFRWVPLHVIDHDEVDGCLSRFQPEAELLHRRENRSATGIGCGIRRRPRPISAAAHTRRQKPPRFLPAMRKSSSERSTSPGSCLSVRSDFTTGRSKKAARASRPAPACSSWGLPGACCRSVPWTCAPCRFLHRDLDAHALTSAVDAYLGVHMPGTEGGASASGGDSFSLGPFFPTTSAYTACSLLSRCTVSLNLSASSAFAASPAPALGWCPRAAWPARRTLPTPSNPGRRSGTASPGRPRGSSRQRHTSDIDPGRVDLHADMPLARQELTAVERRGRFDRRDFKRRQRGAGVCPIAAPAASTKQKCIPHASQLTCFRGATSSAVPHSCGDSLRTAKQAPSGPGNLRGPSAL